MALQYLHQYYSVLESDGTVFCLLPAIMTFTCKLNVTYFPYDRQVCHLRFVSWSYTGAQVDLVNMSGHGDTGMFADNGEWDLLGMPVRRIPVKYPCCEEPFPEVIYYLILQRQHLYYIFNLVLPQVMITAMALLVFYLPAESGEKISLSITVLLSICVFLLMVSERMPATSDTVPLIGQYHNHLITPVNTTHLYSICTMMDQRRRRWADCVQMLYKCFVFAKTLLPVYVVSF